MRALGRLRWPWIGIRQGRHDPALQNRRTGKPLMSQALPRRDGGRQDGRAQPGVARMIRLAIAGALTLLLLTPAQAADRPAREPTARQLAARERMRTCNAEARTDNLHGDPRKAFMRTCL